MIDKKYLLPCPFCGKPARMKITKHVPSGYDYTPQCSDPTCCGRLYKKYTDEEMARDSWNLRLKPGHDVLRSRSAMTEKILTKNLTEFELKTFIEVLVSHAR